MQSATSVICQLMENIMIRMPTSVVTDVIICVTLWLRVWLTGIHVVGDVGQHFAIAGWYRKYWRGSLWILMRDIPAETGIVTFMETPEHQESLNVGEKGADEIQIPTGYQDHAEM